MMTQRLIAYLTWTLPLVMIFCPVQVYGVDSFCIADTVPRGGLGRVSCHFIEDLSKVPQKDLTVYIYRVSDSDPKPVVIYSWYNGQPRIFAEPGYNCTTNLTDHLEILIYNATREHAGLYKCVVVPSAGLNQKTCTLIIEEEKSIQTNGNVPSSYLEDKGVDSFCIAGTVPPGGLGRLSCQFDEDLSKMPQKDLNVYHYRDSDSAPRLVVFYSWVKGQPQIVTEPGYDCISNLTNHLEILIYNATTEHAGDYKCLVAPSTKSFIKTCTLSLEKGYADVAHITQNYTYIVSLLLGCLVLLSAIIVIMIYCFRPKWWNYHLRTTKSASESAEVSAERESLQGNKIMHNLDKQKVI